MAKLKGRPAIRIILAPLQKFQTRVGLKKGEALYGMQQQRTIFIDPRTQNPVSTFMHEKFHMDHPDWTEDQVEVAEHQWWKKSSWREKAKVLQLLGHAEIKSSTEIEP